MTRDARASAATPAGAGEPHGTTAPPAGVPARPGSLNVPGAVTPPAVGGDAPPLALDYAPPPQPPSIGHRAARGMLWFGMQTTLVKLVSFAGQIVLAYILGKADFGFVAVAYTVGMIGSLIARAGVREVLISRGAEYDRWANPAFWMSAVLGVAGTVSMIVLAPVAAWFYKDDRLIGLIVVLSFQHIFAGLNTLPDVRLALDMRFRTLAAIGLATLVGLTLLTVIFAAMGLKAYSFMLPWPCVAAAKLAVTWRIAPHRIRWQLELRHWGGMLAENGLVFLSTLFLTIAAQADYVILGRMYPDKDVVGEYYWAFNLSTQALQLLALNVASVLLPSMAALNAEPARQRDAFLRSTALVSAITALGCLLQAATAGPLIRLLFDSKWYPAIPLVQVLSIGWATHAVFHTVLTTLKARGRFLTLTWLTGAGAAVFVIVVYLGARQAGALGAAVGVMIYAAITGPLSAYVTARDLGSGWRGVWHIFGPPLLAAAAPVGVAFALASFLPSGTRLRDAASVMFITAVAGGLWLLTVRLLMPTLYRELLLRIRQVLGRPAAPTAQAIPSA